MKRLMRILKRLILVGGVLLALALVANAIFVWRTGRNLEARLTILREAGKPLSVPDLGTMPAAPGANAADVLKRIEPELKAFSRETSPIENEVAGIREFNDDDWKKIEQVIANHPTVLPGLEEAAACPSYKPPYNYQASPAPVFLEELLPSVQHHREAARFLRRHAQIQLRKNDRDGAMKTCLTALRLARLVDHEPLMISHLVAIAVRAVALGTMNEVLQAGPVAAPVHQELDLILGTDDSMESFVKVMETERAFGLQTFDDLAAHGGWFTRAFFNDQKCYHLDMLADWISKLDLAYSDFQQQMQPKSNSNLYKLSNLLMPAMSKTHEAHVRMRCSLRCMRVLNALVRRGTPEAPAELTELGLPKEAVTDPYIGKPLRVKRVDGHWLVYGVGPNLQDEGGKIEKNDDIGFGPKNLGK